MFWRFTWHMGRGACIDFKHSSLYCKIGQCLFATSNVMQNDLKQSLICIEILFALRTKSNAVHKLIGQVPILIIWIPVGSLAVRVTLCFLDTKYISFGSMWTVTKLLKPEFKWVEYYASSSIQLKNSDSRRVTLCKVQGHIAWPLKGQRCSYAV